MEITYDILSAKFGKDKLDKALIIIHKAIHTYEQKTIKFGDKEHSIVTSTTSKLRYIKWNGVCIMEQNKDHKTVYSGLAKMGKHISWAMFSKQWVLITDNAVYSTQKEIDQFVNVVGDNIK
jgi:hypothetical protein